MSKKLFKNIWNIILGVILILLSLLVLLFPIVISIIVGNWWLCFLYGVWWLPIFIWITLLNVTIDFLKW